MKYPWVCAARAGPPIARQVRWNRLNGRAEQGLQAGSGERRFGWDGVDGGDAARGARRTPLPLRISKPRWDVGLARDPVMLDCREPPTQGVGSGRYLGEALPAESLRSNKSLTSPTGGPQGLGRRPKRGLSRMIRGN